MKPLSEQGKLDMFAMQIVHLVGRIQHEKVPDDTTSKTFVDIRQASNDEAIEAVKDLIRRDREAWGNYVIGTDEEMHEITPSLPNAQMVNMIRENNYLASHNNKLRAEQRQRNQGEKTDE